MKWIKWLVSAATLGASYSPGDVCRWPADEADRLVRTGQAEYAAPPRPAKEERPER